MFDLKWVKDNAAAFDGALVRRGAGPEAAGLLALDDRRRGIETGLQEIQAERNRLSREVGLAKQQRDEPRAAELMAEVTALRDRMREGEDELRGAQHELDTALGRIPNVLDPSVPDGADETFNRIERVVGEPRAFAFEPRPHDVIGGPLGLDMERAARIAGARFAVLAGQIARLQRALVQFMLDLQTKEHGYLEMDVPYLVRDHALFGTGQLPKFAEDQFVTTTGHWLIPTAEVPLTNLVRDSILDEDELPMRVTAATPCFRSEAGAAGRDTRGIMRTHQFMKVELVSITTPEASAEEHERMTSCAEAVLQRLEQPYRVVTLCAGDTGFSAMKTYDIEVWLPSQAAYREISSCSNTGDFQARRMNARYRPKSGKGTRHVHTLNGSGLAVGRALIAVLENGQQEDGSVRLPPALVPYMDGIDRLVARG